MDTEITNIDNPKQIFEMDLNEFSEKYSTNIFKSTILFIMNDITEMENYLYDNINDDIAAKLKVYYDKYGVDEFIPDTPESEYDNIYQSFVKRQKEIGALYLSIHDDN